MGNDRLPQNASILVLLVAVMLAPGTASAGGDNHPGQNGNDLSPAYSGPIPAAYLLPWASVDATYSACPYTFPILLVHQCPAVMTGQPGSQVVYLRPGAAYGLLGGQPYLYHH